VPSTSKQEIPPGDRSFTVFDIWEKLGVTEHLGGIKATRSLVDLCGIVPGRFVLDIGCGTGYTACLLAKEYGANVMAADISPKVLEWARKRVAKEGVGAKVKTTEANAEDLSFLDDSFDCVIVESVLIHCDPKKALPEIHRTLRPRGTFGANETTFLKPPPPELVQLLRGSSLGGKIGAFQEHEWLEALKEAGFKDVSSEISRLDLRGQFMDHLRVDGVGRYVSALVRGLLDPSVSGPFLNRRMIGAWREYRSYVGYGLYVGRKAQKTSARDDS